MPCSFRKTQSGLVLVCVLVIHEEVGNELINVEIASINVCDPCVVLWTLLINESCVLIISCS